MFGDSVQDDSSGSAMPPAQSNDNLMGMPGMSSPAMSSTTGAPSMGNDSGSTTLPADEMAAASSDNDQSPAASSDMPAQASDDLMSIKQDALQSLKPLVGHLEQTPEEKFRTTMMMIQASDDQSLIPDAYDAAKAIEDEKTRAQALLDVVNEINYFTQQATK